MRVLETSNTLDISNGYSILNQEINEQINKINLTGEQSSYVRHKIKQLANFHWDINKYLKKTCIMSLVISCMVFNAVAGELPEDSQIISNAVQEALSQSKNDEEAVKKITESITLALQNLSSLKYQAEINEITERLHDLSM